MIAMAVRFPRRHSLWRRIMSNNAARHALIVGKTGSGKSYLAKKAMEKGDHIAVFDPMGDTWNSKKPVSTLKEVAAALIARQQVVYTPPRGVDPFAASGRFIEVCWRYQKEQKSPKPLTLIIDEAHITFPNRGGNSNEDILRMGRHDLIGVISITQQLADLSTTVQNNANTLYIFGQGMAEATMTRLANLIGKENAEKTRAFLTGTHWKVSDGKAELVQPRIK